MFKLQIKKTELHDLPCGDYAFCNRARNQWKTFKEDIDYVVPLTVRAVECITSIFFIYSF
jgi:hypothetical protein